MPNLSISFKGIPLQIIELKPGESGIGRDPSNHVHIDSLAVADFHAKIRSSNEGYIIRPLQAGFPVFVNQQPLDSDHLLNDGDHLLIGKHSLHFSHFSEELSSAQSSDNPAERKQASRFQSFEGGFQVMNGKQIGMVIPLKATVTQIGKEATGMVIVTRTEEGYVVAAGSDDVRLTINGQRPEDRESILRDGDIVRINSSLLQFFQK